MNAIDLNLLNIANLSLIKGQVRYNNNPFDDLLMDGVIHRFKVTYDLSHKILKTYLGVISENPKQINQMAFQNWITLAHESGIILNDWSMWQKYRDQRSRTLYSFDLTIANNVLSTISDFIKEVEFFTLNVSGHLKR